VITLLLFLTRLCDAAVLCSSPLLSQELTEALSTLQR